MKKLIAFHTKVSISLISTWPIGLRYYLNLEYGSRQIMANQIEPYDHELFRDWFAHQEAAQEIVSRANCKIVCGKQCSCVLFQQKSSSAVLKMENRWF